MANSAPASQMASAEKCSNE